MYSNRQSYFTSTMFRENIYDIKSHLSNYTNKTERLYIPINYARLISHTFADYEVGWWFKVLFNGDEDTEKFDELREQTDFDSKIYKAMVKKSSMWYSVLRVIEDEKMPDGEKIKIEAIPTKNYFPNLDWLHLWATINDVKEHNIVSIVKEGKEYVVYIDSYQKEENWRKRIYGKYRYMPDFIFDEPEVIDIIDEETLDHLPLFIFNNDLINDEDNEVDDPTNWKKPTDEQSDFLIGNSFFAESDYADCADIIQEINDRNSQVSVEFIKHLWSKMSVPNSFYKSLQTLKENMKRKAEAEWLTVPKNMNNEAFFEWLVHWDGENPAQYITRDSSYISVSFEHIEKQIRFLSAITRIPQSFFSLEESSGKQQVGTMEKQLERFYMRVNQKRKSMASTLKRMCAYIMFRSTWKYEMPSISFKELQAKEFDSKVLSFTQLYGSWLVSRNRALVELFHYDEKELEKEIEEIEQEKEVDAAVFGQWRFANLDDNQKDDAG